MTASQTEAAPDKSGGANQYVQAVAIISLSLLISHVYGVDHWTLCMPGESKVRGFVLSGKCNKRPLYAVRGVLHCHRYPHVTSASYLRMITTRLSFACCGSADICILRMVKRADDVPGQVVIFQGHHSCKRFIAEILMPPLKLPWLGLWGESMPSRNAVAVSWMSLSVVMSETAFAPRTMSTAYLPAPISVRRSSFR